MRWFQVDSNTPNDPKIKALMRYGLAAGGPTMARDILGQVFLLWCYVAQYGEAAPGLGVKADGTPLDLDEMAEELMLTPMQLTGLLDLLADRKLIDPEHWGRGIVFLRGMLKRAETYARSKGRAIPGGSGRIRADAGEIRPKPPLQDKTVQDNTEDQKHGAIAPPPAADLLTGAGEDQVDALVRIWNAERLPGPKVSLLTDSRRRAYGRALKAQPDLQHWRTVIGWLNRQKWANASGDGDHGTWRATLDWLAKPGKLAEKLDQAMADRVTVRADGTEGRNAAKGRTGIKRGHFAEALKGGGGDEGGIH